MPKATPEEYLFTMAQTDNRPILHTVIFESSSDPDGPIEQSGALISAVRGLFNTPGVLSVRGAHLSIDTPYAIEEQVLANNDALQLMRKDPHHDRVLDIARVHTNWRLVDRIVPDSYNKEPELIAAARRSGADPIMRHTMFTFDETVPLSEVNDSLQALQGSFGSTESDTLFPSEFAVSLDRRKGDIALVRTAWRSIAEADRFANSFDYQTALRDVSTIAIHREVTHRPFIDLGKY